MDSEEFFAFNFETFSCLVGDGGLKRFVRSLLLLAGLAALPACASPDRAAVSQPMTEPTAHVEPIAAAEATTRVTTTRTVVVTFESDSADIRAGAMQILYGAAQEVRHARLTAIRIVGHADASGRRAYNQRLSERRAAAVADQLTKLGLTAPRIESSGVGEAPTKGKTQRQGKHAAAEDRRVEITFESTELGVLAPANAKVTTAAATLTPALRADAPSVVATTTVYPPMVTQVLGTTPPSSSPAWLHVAAKPVIKRHSLADGTTRLPPSAA